MLEQLPFQPLKLSSDFLLEDSFVYLPGKRKKISLPSPSIVLIPQKDPRDLFLLPQIVNSLQTQAFYHTSFTKTLHNFQHYLQTCGFFPNKLFSTLKNSLNLLKIYELFDEFRVSPSQLLLTIQTSLQKGCHFLLYEGECLPEQWEDVVFSLLSSSEEERFVYVNLSYDYITAAKSNIHISFSGPFILHKQEKRDEVIKELFSKQKQTFTLTPGHLFSYTLFSPDMQTGISRQYLFYKMNRLANIVYREKTCNVSQECLEYSYDELFATPLQEAKRNGYITYKNKKYIQKPKLRDALSIGNIYYKQYYDLQFIVPILDKNWNEVADYD
ncbi:MAG: hypothetical protein AAF518_02050 [Spirochaetota bacterium]